MDPRRRGMALIILSAVSFGGVAVLTKLVLASGLGVLALSFWRWGIAFAAVAPVVMLARGLRMTWRAAAAAFGLGVVGQVATSGLYTWSLAFVPAALGSFLLYLNPVFVAALSASLLREALTRRGLLALGLAMLGLALLAFAPDVRLVPLGVALALASALAYACTIVAARRLVAGEDPLRVAVLLMAGATAGFAAGALLTGQWALPPTRAAWLHLLLLGVGSTGLSIATFYLALPLLGAPRAALVSTLEPVSTVLVAYVVLGELFTAVQAAGAVLILAAVALLARADARPARGRGPA